MSDRRKICIIGIGAALSIGQDPKPGHRAHEQRIDRIRAETDIESGWWIKAMGISMIRTSLSILAVAAVLLPRLLFAQTAAPAADGVRVGDRFVYDTKDEITGFPKDTYTLIVTEASKDQIVTSLTVRGKPNHPLVTFSHDWALVDNGVWKFKPNNGQAMLPALAVGKDWRFEFEAKNLQNGANVKGSGLSKVLAQEKITTAAGTFDTFKIDTQVREFNTADPANSSETKIVTWFAPEINRWVRQTSVVKKDKRTRTSTSEELEDFSRDF